MLDHTNVAADVGMVLAGGVLVIYEPSCVFKINVLKSVECVHTHDNGTVTSHREHAYLKGIYSYV